MATVNRHYSPSRGKYISQFVPKQLPQELLVAGLATKQKQQDEMQSKVNLMGDWDERAIGWHDQEYVKGVKSDIRNKMDYFTDKDMTDPTLVREYQNWVRGIRDDENLNKVRYAVSQYDKFEENWNDLRKKGQYHAADELKFAWESEINEYSKRGGLGFEDRNIGLDPDVRGGFDLRAEREKVFNNIKASGSESVNPGSVIWTTSGWTGVSGKTIDNNTMVALDGYYNSNAGRQEQALFDMRAGVTPADKRNFSQEEWDNYETEKRNFVKNNLLSTGQEFVHGKSTTDFKFDPSFEGLGAGQTAGGTVTMGTADPFDYTLNLDDIKDTRKNAKNSTKKSIINLVDQIGDYKELFVGREDEVAALTSNLQTGNWNTEDMAVLYGYLQEVSDYALANGDNDTQEAIGLSMNGLINSLHTFESATMVEEAFKEDADYDFDKAWNDKRNDYWYKDKSAGVLDKYKDEIQTSIENGLTHNEFLSTLGEDQKAELFSSLLSEENQKAGGLTHLGKSDFTSLYATLKEEHDGQLEDWLETNEFHKTSIVMEGSSETVLHDYSEAMTAFAEDVNTAWISIDGEQVSVGDLKDVGAKDFKMTPTLNPINGRPGFAMSFIDEEGEQMTKYVSAVDGLNSSDVMDVGLEMYKIGNRKQQEGSYEKANQLKDAGSFTMGFYANSGTSLPTFGKQIEASRPETWKSGQSNKFVVSLPTTTQEGGTAMVPNNVIIKRTPSGSYSLQSTQGVEVFRGSIENIQSFIGTNIIESRLQPQL